MEKQFQNKVVLVTGGSYGIGSAAAFAFAQKGAQVVIADWKEDPQQTILKKTESTGHKAVFIRCDVSDATDVKNMFKKLMAIFGRLDFAFNNAGIEGKQAPTHECSESNWDSTISINLKGVWLCMKEEIFLMQQARNGVIINCSSVAGLQGFANLPAYVASKHGIVGLTKAAALENAKTGIRINAVCPGVIRTAMVERVTQGNAEIEKQYTALEPVGRMGTPAEIAEAVTWLCSDAATFITGIALPVDGGLLAG